MVRVELAAAKAFHKPLRLLHAAPLPDARLEGSLQRLQITGGPLGIEVHRFAQIIDRLCAVGAAEGIAREITEVAHRPVDVLQAAVGVIGYIHAEVLFVLGVPCSGQVGHGQRALHQRLLQLIADHDVQRVGQLVSLGADQAGLGAVDGAPDLLGSDIGQLIGEDFPQGRVEEADKGAAAADKVLKQAGLALVEAHCGAAGHGRVVVGGVDVQLIQCMAALMGNAVEVGEHVALHIVGRDAHIAAPEFGGEGMLALGQIAVSRIQPPQLHDLFADGALIVQRPHLIEKIGAHGLAPGLNVGEQRHDGLAQRGKKRIALSDRQALLVPVKPDLIRVAVGGKIMRLRPAGGHDFFQIRRKQAEIVRALGLDPDRDALVAKLGEGGVLLSRDLCNFIVLALQLADLGLLLLGLGLGGSLLQQGGGVCVDKQLKAGAAQHLAGLGAAIGAALGGNGLGIEINGVERVAVGKKLLFQRTQADDGRLHVGDLVS